MNPSSEIPQEPTSASFVPEAPAGEAGKVLAAPRPVRRPSRAAVILAALFLAVPVLIPLLHTVLPLPVLGKAESTNAVLAMVATSAVLLVLNAVLLYVMYRWLVYMANER